MDPRHEKIIVDNYVGLISLLTDVGTVCAHLYQFRTITLAMKANILQHWKSETEKAADLLDLILTRGPQAFDALYKACLDAELYGAADILQPDKAPHHNLAGNASLQAQPMLPGYLSADGGLKDQQRGHEVLDDVDDDDELVTDYAGHEMRTNQQPVATNRKPLECLPHPSPSLHQKDQQAQSSSTASDSASNVSDSNLALKRAAEARNLDRLISLITRVANINRDNYSSDTTFLMICVLLNHENYVKLLIRAGAVVDEVDRHGMTALIYAASNDCIACARQLIKASCDVNKRDIQGNTALMHAAFNGRYDCLELLVLSLCDVDMSNNKGQTALMFAAKQGHDRCVNLLINAGADLDKRNNDGCTTLMIAVTVNRVKIVELLVRENAGINIADNDNFTPLRAAEERFGHFECAKILRNAGGIY